MKAFKYIFFLPVLLLALASCNSEDFDYDIEYTPIHPIGGQYTVDITRNDSVVAEKVDCFLANTSAL